MRRFALIVVVLGLAGSHSSLARGGTWADKLFAEHGIDFGAVPRGAKVRHPFVMTNRLNEPVNILNVRASCGCTTGRASATTIEPGGTAVIEAEMDTRNFVGKKATVLTVTLLTASGQQAEARIGVQSNILADVVLNPGSADFGAVARGQTPQQVIKIERLGRSDWAFTKMLASESLCRVVTADLKPTYRNGQGVGYQLVIQMKPDAPAGFLREEIRLLTNDAETPSVPILVTAQVSGSLAVTPSLLALGRAGSAAPVQGRFLVRGTQAFRIVGVEGNGDGFELTQVNGEPKPLHVLTLTFRPEASTQKGDLSRTFRVVTDLPGEGPLELNATVTVAP